MMTLDQAVTMRLRQAALVGWTLNRRRVIEIIPGVSATLTLGWSGATALSPLGVGDDPEVDLRDLPDGVSCFVWEAPPDSRDAIAEPNEREIKAAATRLACRFVDRGRTEDGSLTYWMVV